MVFTNYFAANLFFWNWIFVNAWTQPSQNEVTSLIFVRKHFQDLAIEKTGWSYMYTGRWQSVWSLWTWNVHNYFSVDKYKEHTDTGPEPILQNPKGWEQCPWEMNITDDSIQNKWGNPELETWIWYYSSWGIKCLLFFIQQTFVGISPPLGERHIISHHMQRISRVVQNTSRHLNSKLNKPFPNL